MKILSFISLVLPLMVAFVTPVTGAEWQPFSLSINEEADHPASVRLVQSDGEKASCPSGLDTSFQGFGNAMVPLTIQQLKLSLIDIAPETEASETAHGKYATPKVGLNTGVETTGFLKKDGPTAGLFHEESDWSVSTFILFFGVDLDAGPAYFQTQAFVGNPLEDNHLPEVESGFAHAKGFSTDAKGFNAVAGYKFNDHITLEAGYGYMDQKNKKTGSSEEAWAVYAQAILSISPGVSVIPGIGQIDFNQSRPNEDSKDNFFAGAKWEINF